MSLLVRLGRLAVAKVRQQTLSVRTPNSSIMGPGVVLTYSGISNAHIDRFRNQMEWLVAHAHVQPLVALANAPQAMSDKSRVALVFFGAFDSVHRNAIPILDKLGLPATVFVVSEFVGRAPGWDMPARDPSRHEIGMTVGQLSSLRRDLFEIGSLTATHPRLDKLSPGRVRAELLNSMNDLSAALARPVRSLSVPYGVCNEAVVTTAREVGYEILVTPKATDRQCESGPLVVGSVVVNPDDWSSEFELKARGRYCRCGGPNAGRAAAPTGAASEPVSASP